MFDMAPKFDALLVFLEHRYYGVSLPIPLSSSLRYLTIEQRLPIQLYSYPIKMHYLVASTTKMLAKLFSLGVRMGVCLRLGTA